MNYKIALIPILFLSLLNTEIVSATTTVALIGGQNGTAAYAAFVDENGNITPIDLGIPNGFVGLPYGHYRLVAINASGIGLLGMYNYNLIGGAEAAFVGPGNSLERLPIALLNGGLGAVAINESGRGLIGGSTGAPAYAAFVGPGSSVSTISLGIPNGVIQAAEINAAGLGLIGGINFIDPYASYVSSNGSLSVLTLSISNGSIRSLAMNSLGIGLIGGESAVGAYAAFVHPEGSVRPVTLGISVGSIFSVAMNESERGLIGGVNGSVNPNGVAYAALVRAGESPIVLLNLPTTDVSKIFSVDINSYGAGIIGGQGNGSGGNGGFAALVAADGMVSPLTLNLPNALINSVAINDAGVGLIGSQNLDTSAAYAAFVAPGGQVTPLNLQISNGTINCVAINGILNTVTPTSIGSNLAAFNSQFAASSALNTHLSGKHRVTVNSKDDDFFLFVSAGDKLPINSGSLERPLDDQNMVWVSLFGNYVHQKAEGDNPSALNSIGGFLVGYDYSYSDLMFGGAAGYAYNYLGFGSRAGHGSVQEELLTFYGSYEQEYFLVNFALWGGLYQWYNKRNILWVASSKAHTQGWTFTPHFEVATPFEIGISFEPFAMFDYVSNWQGGYTEQGASGLNLVMGSHYSSVLRSEAGLRLFEEWDVNIGKFVFMQKVSYVNQLPFYFNSVTTSFVASSSSFPIAIGSSHVQNLGGVEVRGTFLPENDHYPYITFGFQGEFGSSYQSYFGNIEIGKAF